MLAIKNLEISEALPLLALSPGIVAILAFILIGDWLNIYEWTGIFLMVAGTYVLELNKHSGNLFYPFKKVFHFSKFSYVHTALLLFAVTSLLDRLLLKQFNLPPMTFMAFQQLFYVFFFAAAVLIERKSLVEPFKKNPRDVISLILLISLFTIVYRYTQIEAIKLAPVALVLSVKRLSVLMAVVWGGNLFGENNLIKRFFATVVILAGAVILLNQ
jgi:drug/metabolite transporter (DMT)-like permease